MKMFSLLSLQVLAWLQLEQLLWKMNFVQSSMISLGQKMKHFEPLRRTIKTTFFCYPSQLLLSWLFLWVLGLWYRNRALFFKEYPVWLLFEWATLRLHWEGFIFRSLYNTTHTYFVLAIDLFEVDLVELVVLIKHLLYVGLSYLLQVYLKVFAIQPFYELPQKIQALLEIHLIILH